MLAHAIWAFELSLKRTILKRQGTVVSLGTWDGATFPVPVTAFLYSMNTGIIWSHSCSLVLVSRPDHARNFVTIKRNRLFYIIIICQTIAKC